MIFFIVTSYNVSIIIPVYNSKSSILDLINSLRIPQLNNTQILIGDDCSSDGTTEALKGLILPNNFHVHYFSKNSGPGAVRNFLISKAINEYIMLQDADDPFSLERLEKQYSHLTQNSSIHIVGCHSALSDKSGQWGTIQTPKQPRFFHWLLQNSVVHASIMARREVFTKCQYSNELRIGEDYYLLTQAYLNGYKFYNIPEVLYTYYIEQNDLKTRNFTQFSKLIQAKIKIANLFPFILQPIFIIANSAKLTTSICKQLLSNIFR